MWKQNITTYKIIFRSWILWYANGRHFYFLYFNLWVETDFNDSESVWDENQKAKVSVPSIISPQTCRFLINLFQTVFKNFQQLLSHLFPIYILRKKKNSKQIVTGQYYINTTYPFLIFSDSFKVLYVSISYIIMILQNYFPTLQSRLLKGYFSDWYIQRWGTF